MQIRKQKQKLYTYTQTHTNLRQKLTGKRPKLSGFSIKNEIINFKKKTKKNTKTKLKGSNPFYT